MEKVSPRKNCPMTNFPPTAKPSACKRADKVVRKNVCGEKMSSDKILRYSFSKTRGLFASHESSVRCRLRTVVRCWQRLCFCSSALPKQRPVPDTKRGTKITLIAYTSPRYCRSILLAPVVSYSSLNEVSHVKVLVRSEFV
jgi:hypothetical protein